MQKTILSTADGHSYPILTGAGLLRSAGDIIAETVKPCRVMLVSDSNVAPLYMETAKQSLTAAGFAVSEFVFPAGEESKSLTVLSDLLEAMCEAHMTRTDLAVALGGGITGDMTGFAAGCYLRGIRFVQLPTTLLAAVDASVGGKTAVNLRHGKNLAGLFHQPAAVICDTDTLKTLPEHEIKGGSAEAIKHGILDDPAIFEIYEHGDPAAHFEEIIARSVQYKAKIVTEDPTEKGIRKLLNFGHTPAHAIELRSDFAVSHGYAVGMGMAMMTRAAAKRGILPQGDADRIIAAIRRTGLPTVCPYSAAELAEIAMLDKKAAASDITVILPEKIGRCRMEKIPLTELEALFADGLEGQA